MKLNHKFLLGLGYLFIMLGFSLTAKGAPAYPGVRTYQQPDGSEIHLSLVGDEFFHSFVTSDGFSVEIAPDGYAYYRNADGLTTEKAHDIQNRGEEEKAYIKDNISSLSLESLVSKHDLLRRAQRGDKAQYGPKKANLAKSGNTRIPVILVQYQDKKFKDSDPKATFNNFFNATGSSSSAVTQSVKEYFRNQSKNKYSPTFEIFGPITLSGKRVEYGGNNEYGRDKGVGKMVAEAVLACDSQIDYSQYDYSKDGYCDTVIILYAGDGEASSQRSDAANAIWPCQWSLFSSDYGNYLTLDNIRVNSFAVFNELNGKDLSKIDGIGTVCHEFSHSLGLPDFYDVNYGPKFGMGYWSVLDRGMYNNGGYTPIGYNAYEKEFMGWLSIPESSPNSQYVLAPMNQNSASSEQAVKIISDANPNEYFILENRKKQGWDEYMDAEGLIITHVTYDAAAWAKNEVNTGLQRMTIIPADNNLLMDKIGNSYVVNRKNQEGDLWPYNGKNSFTDTSTPSAELNSGGKLNKPVTEITKNANGTISFWVQKGVAIKLAIPEIQPHEVQSATSATLFWEHENMNDAKFAIELTEKSDVVFDHKLSIVFANEAYTGDQGWITQGCVDFVERNDGNHYLSIGGGNKEDGEVISPLFTTDESGTVTVKIRGCGASYSYLEVFLNDENGEKLYSYYIRLNETISLHEVRLRGKPNKKCSVKVTNKYGIGYLYSTDIYTGDVLNIDVSDFDPTPILHNSLTGRSFTVSNLKPGAKYSYRIKAIAINALKYKDSEWSDYATLEMPKEQISTGIRNVEAEDEGAEEYFNLQGQRIAYPSSPGVYIVRKNGRSFKVLR